MAQPKFKVTLVRENPPPRQMAEVSMTLPADMLLNMIRSMVEMRDRLAEELGVHDGNFAFGKLKSLTITRVDSGQDT